CKLLLPGSLVPCHFCGCLSVIRATVHRALTCTPMFFVSREMDVLDRHRPRSRRCQRACRGFRPEFLLRSAIRSFTGTWAVQSFIPLPSLRCICPRYAGSLFSLQDLVVLAWVACREGYVLFMIHIALCALYLTSESPVAAVAFTRPGMSLLCEVISLQYGGYSPLLLVTRVARHCSLTPSSTSRL
ncbi:hypothetical protein BDQ17DRAFT_1361159, partial [Cyathus striatus]